MSKHSIKVGATYSNGDFYHHWEVRQVLARGLSCEPDEAPECVRYKVLAGQRRRQNFVCSTGEFAAWARHEVLRDENSWRIAL